MHQKIIIYSLINILIVSLYGCGSSNFSKLDTGQKLYRMKHTGTNPPVDSVQVRNLTKKVDAKVIEKDGEVIVRLKSADNPDNEWSNTKFTAKPRNKSELFFPYVDTSDNSKLRREELVWKNKNSILQPVSIPLKYRFKQENRPSELTTSVNLGIAKGWGKTKNSYKADFVEGNKADSFVNKRTFTFALFGGFTTVSLDSSNTNGKLSQERTALGFNTGFLGVIGVNRLNIGLALGIDLALGKGAPKWEYQSVPWIGGGITLDFIK